MNKNYFKQLNNIEFWICDPQLFIQYSIPTIIIIVVRNKNFSEKSVTRIKLVSAVIGFSMQRSCVSDRFSAFNYCLNDFLASLFIYECHQPKHS